MARRSAHLLSLTVAGLVIFLFSGCAGTTASPAQANLSKVPAFIGEWCNKDFKTAGITRVHIRQVGNELKAHMWGRCSPKECDWGEAMATVRENGEWLSIIWDQGFVVREQKLQLQPDGTLSVASHSHYKDNSGRADRDSTEQFAQGLVHDWSDSPAERR